MAGEENNTSPVCYGCLILLPTDHRHPPPPPRRATVIFQFQSSQKQRDKLGTPVKRRYQRDPRVRSPRFGKGKAKGCSSRSSASFPSRTLQNSRVAEGGRACWEAKDPSLPTHPGVPYWVHQNRVTCGGCQELKWENQEIKRKKRIVSKSLKEVAEPLTNWLSVWLADAEVEQEINSICHRLISHYYFLAGF